MKLNGRLLFDVELQVTAPDTKFLNDADVDAVLEKASAYLSPLLHGALNTGLKMAAALGVTVKVMRSNVQLTREPVTSLPSL